MPSFKRTTNFPLNKPTIFIGQVAKVRECYTLGALRSLVVAFFSPVLLKPEMDVNNAPLPLPVDGGFVLAACTLDDGADGGGGGWADGGGGGGGTLDCLDELLLLELLLPFALPKNKFNMYTTENACSISCNA